MYFCMLKIYVMSAGLAAAEEIARLLGKIEPPEDCSYRLEAAVFGDPCEIGTDSAVIIDRSLEALCAYRRHCDERVIFLASAADLSAIDSETLTAADDFWIMPDAQVHDEFLLRTYFAKLLKVMKESSDNRKMAICFHTVIDSLPDLVWFKDNDGAHLIVNNEFCGVVEKTKKQIYKQHHNYIWDVPEDDYENGEAVCRQSEEVVVRERKTCQFEEKITTKDGMRQLITYKSPLIDDDGNIFGTCGMGHDITDLENVTKELRIIIDSIPFGVVIEDSDGDVVAINRFFAIFFPDAVNIVGHSFAEWNARLDKEKIGADQEEEEEAYRVLVNGHEHIMSFQEEPMYDIFGKNVGNIQLIRDVTIQYNYEQQNLLYANTDFLTGLHNRRSLFDYLKVLDKNTRLSLIMLDLDRFKSVNDTFGHAAGDEALEITSQVLTEIFTDGFIARLGGDEFLIALVGEHDLQAVEQRTQKLLDTLHKNYAKKAEFRVLSASAGIVQDRLEECDIRSIENLLKRCDDALYTAKESGRARYCVDRS